MCRDITSELDIIGPLTAPVVRAHGGPVFPAGLGNTILLAQSWLREAPLVETVRSQAARPLRRDRSVWTALAPRPAMIGNRTRARIAATTSALWWNRWAPQTSSPADSGDRCGTCQPFWGHGCSCVQEFVEFVGCGW